MQHIGVRRQS